MTSNEAPGPAGRSTSTSAGGDRWSVAPEALRESQQAVAAAGHDWEELGRWAAAQRVEEYEWGLLGRLSGATAEYNRAVATIAATYTDGARTLAELAASLDEVAARFEDLDASYYRAHGYVQRTLDRIEEPPS